MSTLDEVKKMQSQGLPEDQIVKTLQNQGVPYREISEALSQSKIRAAVEESIQNEDSQNPASPSNFSGSPWENESASPEDSFPQNQYQADFQAPQNPEASAESNNEMPGMEQSLLQTQSNQEQISQTPSEEYSQMPQDAYPQPYAQEYPQYDYSNAYGGGVSPDVISEISEQIVAERMSEMRKNYEKFQDFKTTIETKAEALEERLHRIEQIINTLQSAVLRKVGDYVTNVEDLKKELIATQQSFSKLAPELRKHKAHHARHAHTKERSHKTRKHSKKK